MAKTKRTLLLPEPKLRMTETVFLVLPTIKKLYSSSNKKLQTTNRHKNEK